MLLLGACRWILQTSRPLRKSRNLLGLGLQHRNWSRLLLLLRGRLLRQHLNGTCRGGALLRCGD